MQMYAYVVEVVGFWRIIRLVVVTTPTALAEVPMDDTTQFGAALNTEPNLIAQPLKFLTGNDPATSVEPVLTAPD